MTTYFLDKNLIPSDGSIEIIEKAEEKIGKDFELAIFPDVHHKKGSKVINGLLTSSDEFILPAMLGVENCGFTFGTIDDPLGLSLNEFSEFSNRLKDYNYTLKYTTKEIREKFEKKILEISQRPELQETLNFLELNSPEELINNCSKIVQGKVLDLSRRSLGTLGGGNHFFELHEVNESLDQNLPVGKKVFILHTDSIAVGNYILLLYSNLSELKYLKGIEFLRSVLSLRMRQFIHFFRNKTIFKDPLNVLKLVLGNKDLRKIKLNSPLGKEIVLHFFVSSIFGELNRAQIIEDLNNTSSIKLNILESHSHDSILIEKHNGKRKIIQRNGVQRIGDSQYFVLPGALGTESYIFSPSRNEKNFNSANHGVGRVKDKHLAKTLFSDNETINELSSSGMEIRRVGEGSIKEQNYKAFKDVGSVVNQMEKYELGTVKAKLTPKLSIKG